MTTDLLAYLDQLDEAQEAATPGPWGKAWSNHLVDLDVHPADVALIVAAVNALPKLTAALRTAVAYADELEEEGHRFAAFCDLYSAGIGDARIEAAIRIRRAIIAALTPEQVQS